MNSENCEDQVSEVRLPWWIRKSHALLVSAGVHIILLLIAVTITARYIRARGENVTIIARCVKPAGHFEYDPGIERAVFKSPRIIADKMVEKPVIMLEEEVQPAHDVPRGTSFDNLSNKNLNSTSVVDAYGVGGGAAGAYSQRWGRGSLCGTGGCHLPHGGRAHPNGEKVSGMFFLNYGEHPFVDTDWKHLSTFGVDVDTASFTVARNYLSRGSLPPKDAIRVEEFINYMKYDYAGPWSGAFAIHLEAAPSKFGRDGIHKLLRVGLKGREVTSAGRKDAVLTFVIDVSGSMNIESRLGTVKKSLKMLLDQLRGGDRVGIVVYGTNARLITEPLTIDNRGLLVKAIDSLCAEGSTNAEAGLTLGYRTASENFREGAINRVILCSDGVANVGRTSAEDILLKIKKYADEGIYLSTVGYGMNNYNDVLMEKLADKGNGNYAYVDSLDEARRVMVENLTGMLAVIAKDAKIQVDFNENVVRSFRLLGYENRYLADKDFRNDKVDAGEVGAGHSVTALYEIRLQKDVEDGRIATVMVRYKNPEDEQDVTEQKRSIFLCSMGDDFDRASPAFRLAAATAELAEIMKGSFWAKDAEVEPVIELAETLSGELSGREDVGELLDMADKAKKLIEEKKKKLAALEK